MDHWCMDVMDTSYCCIWLLLLYFVFIATFTFPTYCTYSPPCCLRWWNISISSLPWGFFNVFTCYWLFILLMMLSWINLSLLDLPNKESCCSVLECTTKKTQQLADDCAHWLDCVLGNMASWVKYILRRVWAKSFKASSLKRWRNGSGPILFHNMSQRI